MIASGPTYALRVLAVALLVATVAAWLMVPRLLEAAYEGNSWTFLNDLISGQNEHPLQDYLDAVTRYLAQYRPQTNTISYELIDFSLFDSKLIDDNKSILRDMYQKAEISVPDRLTRDPSTMSLDASSTDPRTRSIFMFSRGTRNTLGVVWRVEAWPFPRSLNGR